MTYCVITGRKVHVGMKTHWIFTVGTWLEHWHGTLCNAASGGQNALLTIVAAAHNRGKEDCKELQRFLPLLWYQWMRDISQVRLWVKHLPSRSWITLCHTHLESIYSKFHFPACIPGAGVLFHASRLVLLVNHWYLLVSSMEYLTLNFL